MTQESDYMGDPVQQQLLNHFEESRHEILQRLLIKTDEERVVDPFSAHRSNRMPPRETATSMQTLEEYGQKKYNLTREDIISKPGVLDSLRLEMFMEQYAA